MGVMGSKATCDNMTQRLILGLCILTAYLLPCLTDSDIKFHEPQGTPKPRGPPLRRHTDIHVNMEEERQHLKEHVKEEYMETEKLDDNALLMQYFRKHDTDNNMRLDGLELIKAIARMEEDDHHDDEGDEDTGANPNTVEEGQPKIAIEEIIPIVDSILEQDDKNKDGYINWPEFMSRQKQHSR